jgi:Flp pilus assembly pilin Flp
MAEPGFGRTVGWNMDLLRQYRTRGLTAYLSGEAGAAAVEYAVLLLVIGGCAAIVFHVLGRHIDTAFNLAGSAM